MRLLIDKCKEELEKSGVTTSDQRIAKTIGVSRSLITKLKQGQIAHVRGELIDALCLVLRCNPCDLIEIEPVELPLEQNKRVDLRVSRPFPVKGEKASKRTGVRKGDSAGQDAGE